MERVQFKEYNGVKVLVEDFSNIRPGTEFIATVDLAKTLITSQPKGSVRALFDATNGHYDKDVLAKLKEFVQGNTPYMKAVAVVGISGLISVALDMVTRVSGRTFKTFGDRRAALEWLAKQ